MKNRKAAPGVPIVDETWTPAHPISHYIKNPPAYPIVDEPYTSPQTIQQIKRGRPIPRSPTVPKVDEPYTPPHDISRYMNRTIYRKTKGRRLV